MYVRRGGGSASFINEAIPIIVTTAPPTPPIMLKSGPPGAPPTAPVTAPAATVPRATPNTTLSTVLSELFLAGIVDGDAV